MGKVQEINIDFIDDIMLADQQLNALVYLETEILDSPEYKLLYGKTQMFYDDLGRSRGGHSYNIGQTAGSMAGMAFEKLYKSRENDNPKLYDKNKKIQEVIGRIMGYSHDLGHTPLGHDGESVLDQKLSKLSEENPALKEEVKKSREEAFKGITVVADKKSEEKSDGRVKEGIEYGYEEFQDLKRGVKGIGYEHNEYSAQIFAKILRDLKQKIEIGVIPENYVEEIKKIDEVRFVTAILAHSRSRFPSIPKDFLAQIVRQADKVEYMNYDYEEYAEMGFFPIKRTGDNDKEHLAFMSIVEQRAKEAGVDTKELLEYLQLSGEDRRKILEERMIEEAIVGIDGKEPKGMIDDNMDAMKMAKICAEFKDDALFYIPEDGKRGLITGNNVEREEVILDKLLQYYFDNPEKIPNEKVVTKIQKLKCSENIELVPDLDEVVSYDPEKIGATNIYDKLKSYLSTLTNEQCETLYQQLVKERIEKGQGHGIEPVTQKEIDARIEKTLAKMVSKKDSSPYSIEHSKEVFEYMPNEMKARIEKNRVKHKEEIDADIALYREMEEADKIRVERQTEVPGLLSSTIGLTKEIVSSYDVQYMAKDVSERSNRENQIDTQKNIENEEMIVGD